MLEFRAAINLALTEELERDSTVIFFGEDVAAAGGVFKVTPGLSERFGPDRVFDTPISELALAGAAFGSAVTGLRPVVEIMFGDFMALAMDSLVNQAAKYWYLSNGTGRAPLVIRSAVGGGVRFGAIHSQIPGTWLQGIPGLKVVCPSTPNDAHKLLKAAVRDDNPVVFLEHKRLYSMKGAVEAEASVPLGKAAVVRTGSDITVVAAMRDLHEALAAAESLAQEGIELEVVDLRSIRPLDLETIIASAVRTGRLLAIEEGPYVGGWATGLVGAVAEHVLGDLDDVAVMASQPTPMPFSPPLEDAYLSNADRIASRVRARLGAHA